MTARPAAPRFSVTDEQRELRVVTRAFLDRHSGMDAVRAMTDGAAGWDRAGWRRMADELGLQALTIPEEFGGAGGSAVDLAVVAEEMGRALYGGPYLPSCVLAVELLLGTGDPGACARHLPAIGAGELVAAVVHGALPARVDRAAGTPSLTGAQEFVLHGADAGLLLVVAREADGGLSLFAVDPGSPGVVRTPMTTLDATRPQARVTLDAAPADLVGAAGGAGPALDRSVLAGTAAVVAEQIGGAARCLEMAVEYAGVRHQFDRPIGSFQAIKHRCADMLLELELARSAAGNAAWALAEDAADAELAVSVAKSLSSTAYVFIAGENIQVHGGMGFTWEHPAHLYFRRARSSAVQFGDAVAHRARIARAVVA